MEGNNIVDSMNANKTGFIEMLGGEITGIDIDEKTCTFEFKISTQFCHSIDVVQGGFITAMLDAAMSHAVFATVEGVSGVSSLEIKTSYLEPTRAGTLQVVGLVIKDSYKTAFLEGRMYNAEGLLSATASSVAKLVRAS